MNPQETPPPPPAAPTPLASLLDWYDMEAVRCRRSLARFIRTFWEVVVSEELIWEKHMGVLAAEIQAIFEQTFLRPDPADPTRNIRLEKLHDLVINIPPGTTKSTIVTIMAPPWAWTRDPTLRVITASYSADLATEHSQKSRDIVTSDLYRRLFPTVRLKPDKGQKTNYETTENGQRFATSVNSTVTGVHAHVIIIDDPINAEQASSKVELKKANRWMNTTVPMRKIDKKVTAQILVMQRLAINDPTGNALEKKKRTTRLICLPGELADNTTEQYRDIYTTDGLLSPARLGRKELDEARVDLGAVGYAGQIQQRPAPEGGTIWRSEWFIQVPDAAFPDIAHANEIHNDWDLAYTKDEVNAASAFITSGIIAGQIYIFDFNWQWLEFPELIAWMRSIPYPHYIEAKASGKSARQTLRRNGIAAIEVKVNRDKIARARDATPVAEAGMVYIRQSQADRLFNDVKQGILFFPDGEFADLADTLSQMLTRRTKKGKVVSSAPDDHRDQLNEQQDHMGLQPPPPKRPNPLDWVVPS